MIEIAVKAGYGGIEPWPDAVEKVFQRPDGKAWDYQAFSFNNSNATPGNNGTDEGFLVGAAVFSFTHYLGPPKDADSKVLAFHFHVKPDAPVGTTAIVFLDGAHFPQSPPVRNVAVLFGKEVTVTYQTTPVFINGRLGIVGDITTFRGDSNGDETLDLSDAQATLSYLFLGSEPLRCFEAADADADGSVNISDPILTLMFLFLGGNPIPPDSIRCRG